MNTCFDLPAEKRATVYLTEAMSLLLRSLECNDAFVRVDLAFKSGNGVFFYYVTCDALRSMWSNEWWDRKQNSESIESSCFTYDATYHDIKQLFKRVVEEDVSLRNNMSLMCEPKLVGNFDEQITAC